MARQNARKNQAREDGIIADFGARCACLGQCGGNHNWERGLKAVKCGAPHGCNVVRKLDNPSHWRLAPLQGFLSPGRGEPDMEGPRTHEAGKYVTRGVLMIGEFAFPEMFDMQRITQIWLSGVVVDSSKKGFQPFCQFCARHLKELRAT